MLYSIAAFYRFVPLADLPSLRENLSAALCNLNILGTLLLASEGLNGTLAGTPDAIERMLILLKAISGLEKEDVKFSAAEEKPFKRLKVRLKKEIITFRQETANPTFRSGVYVSPEDWNALMDDPEVLLLDTRNSYETRVGSFDKAIDPNISTFTEFASYVRQELDPVRHKKIAMFCTGGIRCEKASAFMLAEGFAEVFHLKGGILKYLENIPSHESRWKGECYVFDRRIAVGQGLSSGRFSMCFTCGSPLTERDKAHDLYEEGVACARCYAQTSADDKARFRMRQAQIEREKQAFPIKSASLASRDMNE